MKKILVAITNDKTFKVSIGCDGNNIINFEAKSQKEIVDGFSDYLKYFYFTDKVE